MNAPSAIFRQQGEQLLLEVHVVPRASRTALAGVHGGRLKISLDAPPVEGAANAALLAFLAKQLGIPRRDVVLVRGETSRQKTIALRGVTVARLEAWLADT